jgi:hypothetical protein
MPTTAFKEWSAIVEALGAGEQILILRKGGIAEGKAGFQMMAERFWLFPTFFHEQVEKTKPEAAKWFAPQASTTEATLRFFVNVEQVSFLTNWERVQALGPHHLWTEATIRDRYDWGQPPSIHVLTVRVYRLAAPVTIPLTSDLDGCKSWINVATDFENQRYAPVLTDEAFQAKYAGLARLL